MQVNGYEFFDKPVEDPFWKDQVLGFRQVSAEEIALMREQPWSSTFIGAALCSTEIVEQSGYAQIWLELHSFGG